MVLRNGQQLDVAAVGQRQNRELLALEERLDHDGRARVAERPISSIDATARGRLPRREADDGALAGGEPRGLDHQRLGMAIDIGEGAVASRVNVRLAAVGIPAAAITSLANALDASIWAAAALGPNTARPSARSRSARPRARGTSGPMTVRSMPCMSAASARRSRSSAGMGRLVARSAVPGLPGAQ